MRVLPVVWLLGFHRRHPAMLEQRSTVNAPGDRDLAQPARQQAVSNGAHHVLRLARGLARAAASIELGVVFAHSVTA
jgi:hypothetical protein